MDLRNFSRERVIIWKTGFVNWCFQNSKKIANVIINIAKKVDKKFFIICVALLAI